MTQWGKPFTEGGNQVRSGSLGASGAGDRLRGEMQRDSCGLSSAPQIHKFKPPISSLSVLEMEQ